MTRPTICYRPDAIKAASFVDSLKDQAVSDGVFDSAAATDFVTHVSNQSTGVPVPEKLQALLDDCADEKQVALLTRAILDGTKAYETQHGTAAPADLLDQALHLGYATTGHARRAILDSATSALMDPQSLQPNRAVVAILSAMSEAIPFAHYLPADINSNEARLAILSHRAGSQTGSYFAGEIMDGGNSGKSYMNSSREHKCEIVLDAGSPTGAITGKLTAVQATPETCDPDGPSVKLQRGRSQVYVNGLPVAREVSAAGTGPSAVSGQVSIGGTTHQISGTVNPDNGNIALTATPPLAATNQVIVEGFISYERSPELIPTMLTEAEPFQLYAVEDQVYATQTIGSRTQMSNELGLDSYSEAVIAIQAQHANERHHRVIRKAVRLGAQNTDTFDFAWSSAGDFKVRADVWRDFGSVLHKLSQRMALLTMNHGITHLYVGEAVMAQLVSLPNDIWEPSGVVERPGIYRLGRLFGRYDVYYTPRGITETESSAQVLCIGRATDVARNPFVLGDAVPPVAIPLSVSNDLKTGTGFYVRNFTEINPHHPSAMGCALINIINFK